MGDEDENGGGRGRMEKNNGERTRREKQKGNKGGDVRMERGGM